MHQPGAESEPILRGASAAASSGRCRSCSSELAADSTDRLCESCLIAAALSVEEEETIDAFGDYELLGAPRAGGMGMVYAARQISLDRTVALKLIKAGPGATFQDFQRFQLEARMAASLDHPNIVPIYDIGEHAGQPFFSMRLVEGGNLAERMRETPIPFRQAVGWMIRIARAVHHAHQRGILHRDLKPTNILIDAQGEPQLTDFGLAKLLEGDHRLTHSDAVVGTPHYMSPEQASGRNELVTTATDIYGLGSILYELLTRQPPFPGEAALEVLHRVLHEEPRSPQALNPATPRDLATICLKCLEKEPGRRYATADDLARDLDRWTEGKPIAARQVTVFERTVKWTRRHPAVAALLVLVVAVASVGAVGILWNWRQALAATRRAEQSSLTSSNTVLRLQLQLAEDACDRGRWVTQVRHLTGVLRQQPTNRVAIERFYALLSHRNQLLPAGAPLWHFGAVNHAAFSRDGTRLATGASDFKARVFDVTTGRTLADEFDHKGPVTHVGFSPDGHRLLTCSGETVARLWEIDLIGAGRKRLAAELGGHTSLVANAEFNADGTRIATASWDGSVQLWDVTGTPQVVHRWTHPGSVLSATFSPDGTRLMTTCYDRQVRVWDVHSFELVIPPWPHAEEVTFCGFSPEGRLAATVSGSRVYLWEVQTGKAVSKPLVHSQPVGRVAFSPDETRLATATGSDAGGAAPAVWIWESAADTWQLAAGPMEHEGAVNALEFSPDGLALLTASADRTARLWDARDGQALSMPIVHDGVVSHATFSPDGANVVTAGRDRYAAIWRVRLGRPENLWFRHGAGVLSLEFHPDGHTLLTSARDGSVCLWDTVTGRPVQDPWRLPGPVPAAKFLPDQRRVLAAGSDGRLWWWQIGTEIALGEVPSPQAELQNLDLSASGRFLVAVAGRTNVLVWEGPDSFRLVHSLPHPKGVGQAVISRDGRRVLTAGLDGVARLWDAEHGTLLNDRLFLSDRAGALPRETLMRWVANSTRSAADVPDRIWNTSNNPSSISMPAWFTDAPGRRLWRGEALSNLVFSNPEFGPYVHQVALDGPNIPMACAAFSPDGRQIATATADGIVQFWDGESGRATHGAMKHLARVSHLEFSPDGRRLVTASEDRTARLWNTGTGGAATEALLHTAPVLFARFSADGRKLVTATSGRVLRVWDAETGLPLTDPLPHPAAIRAACFSPDGQRLASACDDPYVRLWDLPSPSGPVPAPVVALAEALAGLQHLPAGDIACDLNRLSNIVEHRLSAPATNAAGRWVHWFLSDQPSNPISPLSGISQHAYWARLLENADVPSLVQAVRMSPTNGFALARLAEALAATNAKPDEVARRRVQFMVVRARAMGADTTPVEDGSGVTPRP